VKDGNVVEANGSEMKFIYISCIGFDIGSPFALRCSSGWHLVYEKISVEEWLRHAGGYGE